jgi:protein-disulfide isomerase
MSKRQEIRARRRREQIRNRILAILLVVAGALFVVFALILPSLNHTINTASTTATPLPIQTAAPRTLDIQMDGTHLGDPNAPVKVDVWEDFQCSSCLSYSENVEPQLIQNYVATGKVYYTYHFYLLIDGGNLAGESHKAADAAMCASAQGRFWDYHDILYANWLGENVGSYTDARLVDMASAIGLDMTSFDQCFQANTYQAQIDQDYADGQAMGVNGTPSVFVNGTMITPGYVPTFEQLGQAIDDALAGQ